MSDPVSRVEYDAALKRVRRAGLLAGAPHHLSIAERLTLAALGLDEPPTEAKPFDVRDHPMAFPSHHDKRWVPSDDSPVPSDRSPTGRKDEPPTEEDAVTPEPAPEIVMDANGHYWRRYDDMLSMVPTTTANENTEIVAVYQRVRSAAFSLLDVSWKGEQPTTDDFPRSRSLDEPPTEAPGDDANLRNLIATLWLYTSRRTWTKLTTEQKELFADVVDADDTGDTKVTRWWRDPVPPAEPPNACPTCEGRGELKQPTGYPINCDECDGTGRTP